MPASRPHALNDAGKGFAVVAQEVRELAQRSATAAKDIKALITKSGNEVQVGVKLVQATGEALAEIGTRVIAINDHIHSIATAATEQSTGLKEVNTAVNQMDQVTQQNAAMVEETSAATHRLSAEAGGLVRLIARFKLSDDALSSCGACPQRAAKTGCLARPPRDRQGRPRLRRQCGRSRAELGRVLSFTDHATSNAAFGRRFLVAT